MRRELFQSEALSVYLRSVPQDKCVHLRLKCFKENYMVCAKNRLFETNGNYDGVRVNFVSDVSEDLPSGRSYFNSSRIPASTVSILDTVSFTVEATFTFLRSETLSAQLLRAALKLELVHTVRSVSLCRSMPASTMSCSPRNTPTKSLAVRDMTVNYNY